MLVSFIITLLLLKLAIPLAHKVGLLDVPNERSSHKVPVPRGAGIVFGFVFIVDILIVHNLHIVTTTYFYAFISLLIVYITGVYDDFKDISSRKKFTFIILATAIAYYDGFAVVSLGHYFGYDLRLGYFSLPFTIFAVVGFTNAINLSDGLDGLAGSISVVLLLGLLYIGIIEKDLILIYFTILLIAPIIAFLLFNWYPAKVFMGDSGSLFLGFSISLLSIYALKYVNPPAILFLVAIPLLDTLIVMVRRKQRKQSLFVADKNHLHHILLNMKKDKPFTVVSLIKMQIMFVLIFVQVYKQSDIINLILFVMLFSIFFNLFDPRLSYRKKEKKSKKSITLRQFL